MNPSAAFIHRPIATTLLTLGVALAGLMAFRLLPVSPLPQVDFPTISVRASLPGASPDTMAATVATPLERALGRIASVSEMTSSSSLGSTNITLQFDLNRNIDGAARDVQAAINAARALLPTGLPSNPTYRKVNPADAPIMILGLTSDTMSQGQMYDAASTILAQKLSQLQGIGQVSVGGSSLPAVRVEANPDALNHYGIGLENVRTALSAANANRPKGSIENGVTHWQVNANDQADRAKDYLPLIVAYKDGAPVRIRDIASVTDSVQDVRNAGSANGRPSVLIIIFRQPGANIIDTVDRVNATLPQLRVSIPRAINLEVMMDRTPTIRASLRDVERTLMLSIALVIMVVFLFLRNARATLIPSIAVPVSLLGTFGIMYLCNYSLDNLSLMALTIATGFVVDDAIVVLENISRHIEDGTPPMRAALQGAREVGFTVLSMSLSLVAVFIPILMMGGIVGRLFREFAVTLSAAILVSLVVSLTTTPMMCARFLKLHEKPKPGRWRTRLANITNFLYRCYVATADWLLHYFVYCFLFIISALLLVLLFKWLTGFELWLISLVFIAILPCLLLCFVISELLRHYDTSLAWALRHGGFMMVLLMITVCLNVFLYIIVPKGFFPQQDVGRLSGSIQADQSISFQAMKQKLDDFVAIVRKDPAVDTVVAFTGGSQRNTGQMFVSLKPLSERNASADEVITRLRGSLAREPGAKLFLQAQQDVRLGGRQSQAQYQYTLQADNLNDLREWAPRLYQAMLKLPILADVNTDQQDKGLQTSLVFNRDTMSRLGITMDQADETLNDAFGQREVSTIYNPLNQYHVVLEVSPKYWQSPQSLKTTYVVTASGAQVPLSAFSSYGPTNTALAVNHQGQFAAATISFNLPLGKSLGDASQAIDATFKRLGVPDTVQGSFQGTAKAFQESFATTGWLVLAALVTIYIVLGVLYESLIHPITILSTLPSAGVGALLALKLTSTDFSLIALIGVILLIGIVKKNAIMMIDFAIQAERTENKPPQDAIYEACRLRFRPIMMTTMAALLGAVPLAMGVGDGAELRQPLGISIVGGLIVSQMLTLYTTPVVYLYLDRYRLWWGRSNWRERVSGFLIGLVCAVLLLALMAAMIAILVYSYKLLFGS